MSWRKPDLNPDTNIQQYQSDRLALQTKLLPNTDKTGSGIYLSPLLSADGKLQVDVNTAPAASNFTTFNQSLFDAVPHWFQSQPTHRPAAPSVLQCDYSHYTHYTNYTFYTPFSKVFLNPLNSSVGSV